MRNSIAWASAMLLVEIALRGQPVSTSSKSDPWVGAHMMERLRDKVSFITGPANGGRSKRRSRLQSRRLTHLLRDWAIPLTTMELCEQALEIFTKAGEGYKIELGSAYQNLAVVYLDLGKPKRALDSVNLALAIWNEALPKKSSVHGSCPQHKGGCIYKAQGIQGGRADHP